ncbi:MAG: hypothetical protein ABIW31_05330, partial [Novosphingobium sp.]
MPLPLQFPRVRRSFLLATALSLSAAFAAPAFADDAPLTGGQTTSVGTGADDTGEEIVVTARHRSEASQKIPLAISVIGGEHIDNTGAFN